MMRRFGYCSLYYRDVTGEKLPKRRNVETWKERCRSIHILGVDIDTPGIIDLNCAPSQGIGPYKILHRIVADVHKTIFIRITLHHGSERLPVAFVETCLTRNQNIPGFYETFKSQRFYFRTLSVGTSVGNQPQPYPFSVEFAQRLLCIFRQFYIRLVTAVGIHHPFLGQTTSRRYRRDFPRQSGESPGAIGCTA